MSHYKPTWDSLDAHTVPDWFHDAKLGIFVHWGVPSVPGWAPKDAELEAAGSSPYADWYPYFMYEEGSPTWEYHRETYGEDVEYSDFIPRWEASNWDPDRWADLFADVGAGYVVLVAEHHDGFPLWDSQYTRSNAAEMGPERDIVAELSTAVRDRDLRFGASYHANYNYYQPDFDGQYGHPDYNEGPIWEEDVGPGPEYVDFMNVKHRELIRRFDPDILWFDTPKAHSDHLNAKELIADFYNRAAERGQSVVVNDRAATDACEAPLAPESNVETSHCDFATPEYSTQDEICTGKWEANRGIGRSFGYNRTEGPEDHLSARELVHTLVDVVSKNGNLLLNVGPRADGTIPDLQRERLTALGEWLDTNGVAIFGTRPWAVAEDRSSDVPVRYTWRDGTLYATALEWPGEEVSMGAVERVLRSDTNVQSADLRTKDAWVPCDVSAGNDAFSVKLPERPAHEHGFIIRLTNVPNPRIETER